MDLMVVNKSKHDLVALCTIAHSLNIDAKRKRPKSSGGATVDGGHRRCAAVAAMLSPTLRASAAAPADAWPSLQYGLAWLG